MSSGDEEGELSVDNLDTLKSPYQINVLPRTEAA